MIFTKTLIYIFLMFWATLQLLGQSDTSIFKNKESEYRTFMILTKECKHCKDEFKIEIWINDNIYLNTIAKDSLVIHIPTALPNDIITIQKTKYYNHAWNGRTWGHNREYKFKIKNKHTIKLKYITKYKTNFPHKKWEVNYDM